MYKFFIILMLLISNSFAVDTQKDIFQYSSVQVSNNISFYAAKIDFRYLGDENTYSAGLLIHDIKKKSVNFGFGYAKSIIFNDSTSTISLIQKNFKNYESILFFMNYHF